VGPSAEDVCDGLDNNCDGAIDNLTGACDTLLEGICAAGNRRCAGLAEECVQIDTPGVEICLDGLDNNCDGQTDEAGCTALPAADTCALAIDTGAGGLFSGTVDATYGDEYSSGCYSGRDAYLLVTVPTDRMVRFVTSMDLGMGATLVRDGCNGPGWSCYGDMADQTQWLQAGTYYLVVEGEGNWEIDVSFP
jgi:hypothetical protein